METPPASALLEITSTMSAGKSGALAAGVKLHGCTVHLVTQTMDEGPILAQAAVPVLPGDTPDTLAARVLAQEHRLYPAALAAFASGRAGTAPPGDAALVNPLPGSAALP